MYLVEVRWVWWYSKGDVIVYSGRVCVLDDQVYMYILGVLVVWWDR